MIEEEEAQSVWRKIWRSGDPVQSERYVLRTSVGQTTRGAQDRTGHGPRVGGHRVGASAPVVPIALGLIALGLVVAYEQGLFGKSHGHGASLANAKAEMVAEAEAAAPAALKDPNAALGSVWGTSSRVACGVVVAKAGGRRFIYEAGDVRLDDGTSQFGADWKARCAASGRHRARRSAD
jgi:hypothetical protein